jgi:uncharacterized protein (DUF58 family)
MLPKELIKKIRKIEISTRRVVNETLSGQYHSVFKGRGMAFDEVRQYQPGDEIRAIDWNVTARMNDAYVKVFVEERELTVMLLVDLSASQDFGTRDKTKGEQAAELAALLAFSAISNNDRVGLILFTDRIERFVPPKKGRKHALRVISDVLTYKPQGKRTDLRVGLDYLNRITKRRSVCFLISDFIADKYEQPLRIAARRHDLIAVSLRDQLEAGLWPLGIALVEDPETGERMHVDLSDPFVRKAFSDEVQRRRDERKRLFSRLDMDQVEVTVGDEYVKPLVAFFRARAKRRAA